MSYNHDYVWFQNSNPVHTLGRSLWDRREACHVTEVVAVEGAVIVVVVAAVVVVAVE